MSHYVPLFEQIVDSSLWDESDSVVKVFLSMLAKKRKNDVVYGTAYNIAKWARKSEAEVLEALKVLSAPDTKRIEPQPFEGRRIKKVDGGWLMLNGRKFQRMMVAENTRQSNADAQARYKARKRAECSTATNGEGERGGEKETEQPESKEESAYGVSKDSVGETQNAAAHSW